MQAIRPHSPNVKKAPPAAATTCSSANSNKSEQPIKSVAQRVMEVAGSAGAGFVVSTVTQIQKQQPTVSQQQQLQAKGQTEIIDKEQVNDIASFAANIEVGAKAANSVQQHTSSSGSRTIESDQNNNNNGNGCILTVALAQKSSRADSKSPSLLLDNSNAAGAATPQTSITCNIQNLISSDSVFRKIVAKNMKQSQELIAIEHADKGQPRESVSSRGTGGDTSGGSSVSIEREIARISLDTRVPLPSKASTTCDDGEYQEANLEEEVSYYNDQATTTGLQLQDSQRNSSSSSSISNNNNNTYICSNNRSTTASIQQSNKQNNARPKSLAAKQGHKLSVVVPTTTTSCSAKQQLNLNSREYLNELNEVDDDDYDDYDSRYDNAMVEEKTAFGYERMPGVVSIPTSPKAKSAPATPCNVTPSAFHQNTSHLNSMLNPSPANTLPPDIRMNISNTCRVLPSSISSSGHNQWTNSSYLDELIQRGDSALDSKDYHGAIRFYSQCIELASHNQNNQNNQIPEYLEKNFKVYDQRAEAHFYLQNYNEAIEDSMAARKVNPKWTQAYYRQGRAQFLIGQYADSLAAFSFGLAQEPTNRRLFEAIVDAALKSTFKADFEPKYNKLRSLNLDKNPFVVVSVLGQELLAKGHGKHAAIILESALKLGADNKNFKGSVLSAIGFAHCLLKNYDKALSYMQKELDIESELEDVNGQCRVLSNLGYTYYKIRKFDKSLESHRKQMSLAMRTQLYQQASQALNAIGHVHAARNDFTGALTSHTRCLEILKQLGDNDYNQFREYLSIGHIHSMLGDYKAAEEKYNEGIQLLDSSSKIRKEECHIGRVMVNFNFAYLALKKQSFIEAKQYYETVIKLAQKIPNPKRTLIEMRASNGMGQTHRLFKKFDEARLWFERQLDLAKQLDDLVGKSQALCNLGMTYQHFKDYTSAWVMFEENLSIVGEDPLLKAYAHSYMGSMYFLMNRYTEAQAHYQSSLNTFKDLNYYSAEKKTIDLNMAAVCERMGHSDMNLTNSLTQQRKVMIA